MDHWSFCVRDENFASKQHFKLIFADKSIQFEMGSGLCAVICRCVLWNMKFHEFVWIKMAACVCAGRENSFDVLGVCSRKKKGQST